MDEREFTIGQVAGLFFDRNTQWLRYMEKQGRITDRTGRSIGDRRPNAKLGGGDRVYTLKDVEEVADALQRQGYLDAVNRTRVRKRVEAFAEPVEVARREGR